MSGDGLFYPPSAAGGGAVDVTDRAARQVGVVSVTGTVAATQSGAWSVAQSGAWSVAQSGAWTMAATQSGTWTVTESARAADGATTEPTTDLVSGWDGLNVRALNVQAVNGRNTAAVHDYETRRVLEDVLIELRILNVQTARALGVQGLSVRDFEPIRLIR